MTKEEMIEAILQYYEAAGMDNPYEKIIKRKTESEIKNIYEELFENADL